MINEIPENLSGETYSVFGNEGTSSNVEEPNEAMVVFPTGCDDAFTGKLHVDAVACADVGVTNGIKAIVYFRDSAARIADIEKFNLQKENLQQKSTRKGGMRLYCHIPCPYWCRSRSNLRTKNDSEHGRKP